jgi:hypothetical protein
VPGVRVEQLTLGPEFQPDTAIGPAAPTQADLTLISFQALRHGDEAALAACFQSPLRHGFAKDEVAPLALDALRDVAVRKLLLRDVANGELAATGITILREDHARAPSGSAAVIVSQLGFSADSSLIACVSACTNEQACGSAVRAGRLSGDLAPPPPPGLFLTALLAGIHHPEPTIASALAVLVLASALAVRFRRRPKSAADRKARHFFV